MEGDDLDGVGSGDRLSWQRNVQRRVVRQI
jgi:hypothetical protein